MTSKIPEILRRPTERQFEKAFAPYAIEIGQLARAWNALHDQLGQIFSQIVTPARPNISIAIWYSTPSDRTQRDMLKDAYLAVGAIDSKIHPKAKEDIKWLIDQVQCLADRRNDAIHAPISIGRSVASGEMIIKPDIFYGNPRARKLYRKELLPELRWYRMCAVVLKEFSVLIWLCLRRTDGAWPEKPQLPTLGQTHFHRPSRRKNNAKRHRPQPRSLPG
jgi:hypothetical protein